MQYENTTVADVLTAYERGQRLFSSVRMDQPDFRARSLAGIEFIEAALPDAIFDGAELAGAAFHYTDLKGASFAGAHLSNAWFFETRLRWATLRSAELFDAVFDYADLDGSDLVDAELTGTHFVRPSLADAVFNGASLSGTTFSDVDLSALCDATGVVHLRPSYVDLRSVLLSYKHPDLKGFLVRCGVPPSFAEYTILAAEAEGEDTLRSLMRSTFISYGGPDEAFARRLYEALRADGVTTFFFPESARIGRRIGDEVHSRIQEHDRVILVCSCDSLDRPGVRNEIQETFDREARDGGATYLLPIMLDDYVLEEWRDPLAARVRDRVVGDFRDARDDTGVFDRAMRRLLEALRKQPG